MAVPMIQVPMLFSPLLEAITDCLGYPKPTYHINDLAANNVSVCIRTSTKPNAYVYEGQPSPNLQQSTEIAARTAVLDLMKRASVHVEDVTSLAQYDVERCAGLYKMKSTELDRCAKGWGKLTVFEELPGTTAYYSKLVSVNFISILEQIIKIFAIPCTPMEVIKIGTKSYTAWFTIAAGANNPISKNLFSSHRGAKEGAKQNLALRALEYLQPLYNFQIIDANYNPEATKNTALLCALERQNYIATKKRVLGIKEEVEPATELIETDCITPKAAASQIPITTPNPPPMKKQKRKPFLKGSSSTTSPIGEGSLLNIPPKAPKSEEYFA